MPDGEEDGFSTNRQRRVPSGRGLFRLRVSTVIVCAVTDGVRVRTQ